MMGKAEILKENGTDNSRHEKVPAPGFCSGVFFDREISGTSEV